MSKPSLTYHPAGRQVNGFSNMVQFESLGTFSISPDRRTLFFRDRATGIVGGAKCNPSAPDSRRREAYESCCAKIANVRFNQARAAQQQQAQQTGQLSDLRGRIETALIEHIATWLPGATIHDPGVDEVKPAPAVSLPRAVAL